MKFLAIVFFSILPQYVLAQMSQPSVFPEMRTVNPAVISKRKAGNMKVSVLTDSIKREQTLTTLNGAAFSAKEVSKISFTDGNYFYGGKGGGFTQELTADYTKGKRTTTLTGTGASDVTITTDASSSYGNYAFGAGWFGMGFNFVQFNSSYTFNQTFNGTTFNSTVNQKVSLMGVKPGITIGGPGLSLGLTAEYNKLTFTNSGTESSKTSTSMKNFGVALGTGGTNTLLELGVEFDPLTTQSTDSQTGVKMPMPMKISFLAETKFSSITFGYKGMAFKGFFMDLDKIIPTQLVYVNPGSDIRLEHVFNFSLGGSTGWSFGGSASISNTTKKEKSTFFSSTEKYDTKTSEFAASAKVSYVF